MVLGIKGKGLGVMEGRRLSACWGEITEFLRNDPNAVTGYLRKDQDLQLQTERLLLYFRVLWKNRNN